MSSNLPPPRDRPFSSGVAGGRSLIRRERLRSQITIEIEGLDNVLKYFDKLGDALQRRTAESILRASIIVQREIMRNISKRFTQRTGKFRKSWRLSLLTKQRGGPSQLAGSTTVGIVGSDHPAAWIQDVGRTIHAKRRPMPVPLTEEARRKRASGFDRELEAIKGGFLVENTGQGLMYQFLLATSVTIQGTNYLHEAVQKSEPKILAEVGKGIGIAVERGK